MQSKILETQVYTTLFEKRSADNHPIYELQKRVTDYVCPKIVQVYGLNEIYARDVPQDEFRDDIRSMIMFRGLEATEFMSGQTFEEYKSF